MREIGRFFLTTVQQNVIPNLSRICFIIDEFAFKVRFYINFQVLPFWNQLLPLKTCVFKCNFQMICQIFYRFISVRSFIFLDLSSSCIQKENSQTTEFFPTLFLLTYWQDLSSICHLSFQTGSKQFLCFPNLAACGQTC